MAEYSSKAMTVAGGNGWGKELNQLARPLCIFVDDDQTVYVSDHFNHRIVEWKSGSSNGRIVAGGNGQLNGPLKIILDKVTNSWMICDYFNKRVVRWSREHDTIGEIIVPNVACSSMMMGQDGYLYVVEFEKQQVIRWNMSENTGTVLISGDNLGYPLYIFVDQENSIYTSDRSNHRVMKWTSDGKEGIIVAGGRGNSRAQLASPHGIFVDSAGTLYVADAGNHRIVRWPKGASEGSIVVGGDQLDHPCDLSFDRENNLYVLDYNHQRVQKFSIY